MYAAPDSSWWVAVRPFHGYTRVYRTETGELTVALARRAGADTYGPFQAASPTQAIEVAERQLPSIA